MYTTYIAWEVLIWTVFRLKTNVPEKSSPIRIFELCIQRISFGKSLFEQFFVWKLFSGEKFANSYLRAVYTTYIAWEVVIWTVFRLKTNFQEKSSPIRIFELCMQRISLGKSYLTAFRLKTNFQRKVRQFVSSSCVYNVYRLGIVIWTVFRLNLIFRRKVRQFVSSSCVYNVYRLGSPYLNRFSSEN